MKDNYTKEQRKLYNKQYRQNNKEKWKVIPDRYSKEDRKVYNESDRLKRLYGITLADYNEMFASQKGCCAICKKHQTELTKRLFVDHNHSTSKVRKLLCFTCNAGLGLFKEDKLLLKEAIKYLEENG